MLKNVHPAVLTLKITYIIIETIIWLVRLQMQIWLLK